MQQVAISAVVLRRDCWRATHKFSDSSPRYARGPTGEASSAIFSVMDTEAIEHPRCPKCGKAGKLISTEPQYSLADPKKPYALLATHRCVCGTEFTRSEPIPRGEQEPQ